MASRLCVIQAAPSPASGGSSLLRKEPFVGCQPSPSARQADPQPRGKQTIRNSRPPHKASPAKRKPSAQHSSPTRLLPPGGSCQRSIRPPKAPSVRRELSAQHSSPKRLLPPRGSRQRSIRPQKAPSVRRELSAKLTEGACPAPKTKFRFPAHLHAHTYTNRHPANAPDACIHSHTNELYIAQPLINKLKNIPATHRTAAAHLIMVIMPAMLAGIARFFAG